MTAFCSALNSGAAVACAARQSSHILGLSADTFTTRVGRDGREINTILRLQPHTNPASTSEVTGRSRNAARRARGQAPLNDHK
jgi:hypothetical protein